MIDFLIVGGGFSGIAFSWELEQKNIRYKLADPVLFNSATAVSGGLINPVTVSYTHLTLPTSDLV